MGQIPTIEKSSLEVDFSMAILGEPSTLAASAHLFNGGGETVLKRSNSKSRGADRDIQAQTWAKEVRPSACSRASSPRPGTEEQPDAASQPSVARSYSNLTRKKPFSPMGESGPVRRSPEFVERRRGNWTGGGEIA